jgi:hypothetical protein
MAKGERKKKEGILLCYYYTHPYSAGLLLVIQNFTISENACAVCGTPPPLPSPLRLQFYEEGA